MFYLQVYVYTKCMQYPKRPKENMTIPVSGNSWAAMWVVRIKPRSSGRGSSTLNYRAISPAPLCLDRRSLKQVLISNQYIRWSYFNMLYTVRRKVFRNRQWKTADHTKTWEKKQAPTGKKKTCRRNRPRRPLHTGVLAPKDIGEITSWCKSCTIGNYAKTAGAQGLMLSLSMSH